VELLVVVAIIGILAALAMGGLSNTIRSSKLTNTAQRVADQINMARQIAASRNVPVEVRIYCLPYFGKTTGGAYLYRGIQLYTNTTSPVSRPFLFPERVVARQTAMLQNGMTLYPFSGPPCSTTDWGDFKRSGYGFQSFLINPTGICSSGGSNTVNNYNNWFIIQNWEQDSPCGGSTTTLPQNYAVVRVDPITAKATILRP